MFIKFLQSSLFSPPSPLAIVLASPLLNLSSVLVAPDVPLNFCVRSTVQYQGRCIILTQWCFKLNTSATKETHLRMKSSDTNAICPNPKMPSHFAALIQQSAPLTWSTASPGSSRHERDLSWPVDWRCWWESCVEQTGAADFLSSL